MRLDDLPDCMSLWPTAGRFLGLGRNATFSAARCGQIPTIRIGKRLLVSRVALQRLLEGSEPAADQEVAPARLHAVR